MIETRFSGCLNQLPPPTRMVMINAIFISIVTIYLTSYLSCHVSASRVSEKIYLPLQSNHYCSRRFNSTHQMGCSSELGGNLGVVWVVEDQTDLDHVLKHGPTPPYMVVIRREQYSRKNLLEFSANPDRVAGVVFFDEDSKSRSSPFSPEYTCPNKYSGLYRNDTRYGDCKQNQWQSESPVSGLLYDDIPYPIFLMNEKKSIDDLEACFNENNIAKGTKKIQDTYPLCSMQLDSFMLAAVNTKYCLNRRSLVNEISPTNSLRCATVENANIFAYYKPTNGSIVNKTDRLVPAMVEPQSVVMLMAKLSSLSMFSEISPGADSTITSIVTLLAVAEALGRVRNSSEVESSNRNIVFSLLDSEPFDYTGSSRMVYDMERGVFPYSSYKMTNETYAIKNINLSSIEYIIDLDQVANYPTSNTIYLHTEPNTKKDAKLRRIIDVLEVIASREKVKFEQVDPQLPLPPTSVQQFIKNSQTLPDDRKPLGLVLSNYGKTYSNLFYHSIYDDSHNIYQTSREKLVEHLAQVASFVAKSLYQLAFKLDKTDNISVNKALIEEMLECYMKNATCNLFTRAWQAGQQLPNGPVQTYKDPTSLSSDLNGAITKNLLAYFIGDKFNYNLTKCHQESDNYIYFYDYVNGKNEPIRNHTSGVCILSQVFMSSALSPAFGVVDNEYVIDEEYPAWSVSFNGIRNPVRIYMMPSPLHQWCIFFMGIVVTGMAFMIIYRVKSSVSQLSTESNITTGTST